MKPQLTIRDLFWLVLTPLVRLGGGALTGALIGGVGTPLICPLFLTRSLETGDMQYFTVLMAFQGVMWGSMVGLVAGGLFAIVDSIRNSRPMEFLCPNCQLLVSDDGSLSGKAVACPKCNHQFICPSRDRTCPANDSLPR